MIDSITFHNFRRLQHFRLKLGHGNILVGPNNAGKSSILDSFRLLSACLRFSRTINPKPMTVPGGEVFYGYEVSDGVLPFDLANITTNYSDEDAIIEFVLSSRVHTFIRMHPSRATKFYINGEGIRPTTSSKFRAAIGLDLVLVPTLAPLEAVEEYVRDETVRKNSTTRLASRVLRNIWLREGEEEFQLFKHDVESAWPDVSINKPELVRQTPPIVQMFYTEARMLREVQWAGFGFQVWLQILTHIRRGTNKSILIIDEPDIYLHPDLQKRLLHQARRRFSQFVMATHSTEIINEANANELVSINPRYTTGKRIRSDDDFETLYRYLGSRDNADFTRIARAKRVIFVEGKDGKIIRKLANNIGLTHLANPQGPPIIQLGGFFQSPRAAHALWAFREILAIDVEGFCLFDRDYRCDERVTQFLADWKDQDVSTRVLKRKEIENYLLVPSALLRAIAGRLKSRGSSISAPSLDDVVRLLRDCTDKLQPVVTAQLAADKLSYINETGGKTHSSTAILDTMQTLNSQWADTNFRLRVAPGKQILQLLNESLQATYKISLSDTSIIENLSSENLDTEFVSILEELDNFCNTEQ